MSDVRRRLYKYYDLVMALFVLLTALFVREFSNSYVLAKMKIKTIGRHLLARTIGSTIVGEGVDSLVFYPVAFYGVWANNLVLQVMMSNYIIKVLWEAVVT